MDRQTDRCMDRGDVGVAPGDAHALRRRCGRWADVQADRMDGWIDGRVDGWLDAGDEDDAGVVPGDARRVYPSIPIHLYLSLR